MGPAFDREAGHLSAHHAAFVAHWLRLLALEEAGLAERRSEIWRLHGALNPGMASGMHSHPSHASGVPERILARQGHASPGH